MRTRPRPRVLFRVAAGPRMGYGHLVRAVTLAEALGQAARVSVRGGRQARAAAAQFGARVVAGPPRRTLAAERPDVLVIDDYCRRPTLAWRAAARLAGIPVASIHDAGIAAGAADLFVDGSAACLPAPPTAGRALVGPRFAVIRPPAARTRDGLGGRRVRPLVLLALGGGPRLRLAIRLANAVVRRAPDARVRIAAGLGGSGARLAGPIELVRRRRGLARDLAAADVVVTGGGVTMYEACAASAPSVAVAIVAAQRPAIEAMASRGAVVDGGGGAAAAWTAADVERIAAATCGLLADRAQARRLSRRGASVVGGHGAARVAAAIVRLAAASRGGGR